MSLYGVALGLAAVSGQIIGGALVRADVLGLGRGCFLINVPIGLAALALTPRLVPESRAERRAPLDIAGSIVLTRRPDRRPAAPDRGPPHGWPAVDVDRRSRLRRRSSAVRRARQARRAATALLDLGAVREPLVLRRARDAAPPRERAGVVLRLPRALPAAGPRSERARGRASCSRSSRVAYVATSARRRARRALRPRGGRRGWRSPHGRPRPLAGGDRGRRGRSPALVPGLLLVGAGIGLCFTPLTTIVLGDVEPAASGAASGALSTTQQIGLRPRRRDHRRRSTSAPPPTRRSSSA